MASKQRIEQRIETGNVFEVPVSPPKKVVSVKLEVDIIEEMDRLWRSLGYTSRSEFIREAILYYMQVVASSQTLKSSVSTAIVGNKDMNEPILSDEADSD
ncbi:ribbon-helix-helix domain-containing protein [Pyrodictium occultum]|nr:ribbon-helix-helix domain-containing protein [Pyrodictium occultum]